MLNCLVALTFQIVGATSVLIVYSLRWLLLLKSKDEQKPTKPSSPSRESPRCPPEQTSPCLGQGGASIQGPDQGRTPERVRVEAMRRTYRETIHRNETLDSGEAKTLRKQFVSRSVYSPVNIMHAINIRSTKYFHSRIFF